jgi:hypothetical protein
LTWTAQHRVHQHSSLHSFFKKIQKFPLIEYSQVAANHQTNGKKTPLVTLKQKDTMHSKVLLLSLLSPVAFGIPFWHYVSDNEIDSISATPFSTPCATPTPTPIYGFPEGDIDYTPEPTFATPIGTPVFGSPTPTPSPGGYEEPSYPELDDTNAIYYHFDDAA